MRNWTKTTPNASFKGFPFYVEDEGVGDAGRLVALHPFAKAETHGTEDMGRKVRHFQVTAYIVGDDADARAAAFVERCSSPGPGMLVLPITPAVEVRCIDCSTNNRKTEQGKVAFALKFVEKGAEAGGIPAVALGDRLAQNALGGLGGLVRGALSALPF